MIGSRIAGISGTLRAGERRVRPTGDGFVRGGAPCYHRRRSERSHSGLVRRFAKPLKGVSSSEGSNPSLSATDPGNRIGSAARVPVAQWIERQVADLKVGGSSPLGHATPARQAVLGAARLPSLQQVAHELL